MNQIILTVFIVFVGSLIAIQGVANSALGKHLGEPLHAALISFGSGFLLLLVLTLTLTEGLPDISKVAAVPKVTLIGGALGVVYVTSMILFVPKIGVASALIAALCGQVILSILLDHFGVLGLQANAASPSRIAGGLLIILGLFLINYKSIIRHIN
ncbi:DMT family transporter [Opitutales bacterium]|nr:DMT family transporter [Opitutales bacterium]